MENFGEIIRKRRKQLGVKVYELANMVNVNPVYITQIEKHNKLPSFEVFDNIIKRLDLDPLLVAHFLEAKSPAAYKKYLAISKKVEKNMPVERDAPDFYKALESIYKTLSSMKKKNPDSKDLELLTDAVKELDSAHRKTRKTS